MAEKKKVAAVVTEYRKWSHADVIVGKILEGYNYDGKETSPTSRSSSMYVDQFPDKDMSRDLAKKYGFKICDSHCRSADAGRRRPGGRRRALHRRARQVSDQRPRARSSIRAAASSRRSPTSSQKSRSRCRSSTTSTWRRPGRTPNGCTTARASCSCRSWPVRRCR